MRKNTYPAVDGDNQLIEGRLGCRYLYNKNDMYIGRSLEAYGEFSGTESDFIESLLRPGDLVIEVGANIGALSVGIARRVGTSGRLIAFEAQRVVYQVLCANVALNGLTNVDCYWMAIGAQPGTMLVPELDFSRRQNFGGLSLAEQHGGRAVPCGTLDGIADLPKLSLVKIDVEGMEADVIQGGRGILTKLRPMLYVENDRRDKSPTLISIIDSLGYDMYWHLPPLFRPGNHLRNPTDIFGNIVSVNMLCVPRERQVAVALHRVTSPQDRPPGER